MIANSAATLLSIVRRVMPTIIANDIVGVSPMTGPIGDIFMLKERYTNGWRGRVKLTKDHYRYFLRVYNRRVYHHPEYLTSLGYTHTKLTRRDDVDINATKAKVWCTDNLKQGSWICSHADFWFADQNDYILFTMSCL